MVMVAFGYTIEMWGVVALSFATLLLYTIQLLTFLHFSRMKKKVAQVKTHMLLFGLFCIIAVGLRSPDPSAVFGRLNDGWNLEMSVQSTAAIFYVAACWISASCRSLYMQIKQAVPIYIAPVLFSSVCIFHLLHTAVTLAQNRMLADPTRYSERDVMKLYLLLDVSIDIEIVFLLSASWYLCGALRAKIVRFLSRTSSSVAPMPQIVNATLPPSPPTTQAIEQRLPAAAAVVQITSSTKIPEAWMRVVTGATTLNIPTAPSFKSTPIQAVEVSVVHLPTMTGGTLGPVGHTSVGIDQQQQAQADEGEGKRNEELPPSPRNSFHQKFITTTPASASLRQLPESPLSNLSTVNDSNAMAMQRQAFVTTTDAAASRSADLSAAIRKVTKVTIIATFLALVAIANTYSRIKLNAGGGVDATDLHGQDPGLHLA